MANNYSKKYVLLSILLLAILSPHLYSQIHTEPNSLDITVIEGTSLSTQITVTNDTNSMLIAHIKSIFGPANDYNSLAPDYTGSISAISQTLDTSQHDQTDSNYQDVLSNYASLNAPKQKTKILLPLGKEHKPDEILVRFRPLTNGKKRSTLHYKTPKRT